MELKQSDLELAGGKEPKLPRSRVRFSLVIVVMLVLGVVVIVGFLPHLRKNSGLGAQTLELTIPTVTVVSPKPGQPGAGLPLPAEIKPKIEAPIYARDNGYLKRRLVDIGDHVKVGQLLAEIDTPELDQELERARAQLAQAEATLGLAKITSARWTDLLKTASVSEQETAEKQADFKLKTAIADSARAEVRRLEKLKSFAGVTAPFNGKVTTRNIDAGDLIVGAGGKELFHLAQTQTLRVYVQVPQSMARSITSGQSAEMTLPELPGRTFKAKVVRTAGVISSESRTLLVELEVDNSKDEILAGGYAQVRFTDAKIDAAMTLPANTVMFRADGPQIGIVQADGKVDLRKVKLGRDFGQIIEILDGLSPADRVMANPPDSLLNGSSVQIAETPRTEKTQ
jgi:RND family efflux transporter MFP subunit